MDRKQCSEDCYDEDTDGCLADGQICSKERCPYGAYIEE
jgi:hypothetical protein